MLKVMPGNEEESARQRRWEELGAGARQVEAVVCADKRKYSACMI